LSEMKKKQEYIAKMNYVLFQVIVRFGYVGSFISSMQSLYLCTAHAANFIDRFSNRQKCV